MAKKLASLAEDLKQLLERCDVVDEFEAAADALFPLWQKHAAAFTKLDRHIENLKRAGASGENLDDFANDPTVRKSTSDILQLEAEIVRADRRFVVVGAKITLLLGQTHQLVAKTQQLVNTAPELKPVLAGAKELLNAITELRQPGQYRNRRRYFT